MSIVTISRGSHTRGGEVAEAVARGLGYRCVAREVLIEASSRYNIPEAKLIRAAEGAVSFLDRLHDGRRRYVAYIRAAVLDELAADDVVYHGLAGQYFVSGVSHVLKVRIEADLEERVEIVMARDRLPAEQAQAQIARNDREREQWCLHLYGIGPRDPALYDLVLRVGRLTVDDAARLICESARLEQFRSTPASRQQIADLALAARVECALVEVTSDVEVLSCQGHVIIKAHQEVARSRPSARHLERIAGEVPGVATVRVDGCLHGPGCTCHEARP